VGDYIVEDMVRGGLHGVTGVNFTDTSKEAMATALRENMRRADCPGCGWSGYIEDVDGEWRTTCPEGCRRDFCILLIGRQQEPHHKESFLFGRSRL
jgi:hypothetical protein